MNCLCPKCNADIQIDRTCATETGIANSCPECKSRFWLLQEPFILRAFRKAGRLYCHKCGSPLGHSNMCEACGDFFPAYCVVQLAKPVRRRARNSVDSSRLAHKPTKQMRATSHAPARAARKPQMRLVGLVMLVAVLAVAVGFFALDMKAEQQFARNYVLALYGVKSGADRSLNLFAKISSEGKSMADAGQVFLLRIGPEEKSDLKAVKVEIDKVMQQLGAPPEKFTAANDKLARLYQVYAKIYALNLSPPDSLSGLADSAAKLDGEFNRATQELKAVLPEELLEEIRQVAPRYKNLQSLIAK